MDPDSLANPTTKIEIVQLPVSEWQTYKNLRLRALKEDPQAFGSSFTDQVKFSDDKWQQRLATGEYMLFAKLDGKVVGMMAAYPSEKGNHVVDIVSVYIVAEARGKGVSIKLLEELLKRLKIAGFTQAHLSVTKDQIAAVSLYRKFGFQIIGEEENVLGDKIKHTELLMSKEL